MRTYTHGVIGYLLYAKRSRQEQQLAIIGGVSLAILSLKWKDLMVTFFDENHAQGLPGLMIDAHNRFGPGAGE